MNYTLQILNMRIECSLKRLIIFEGKVRLHRCFFKCDLKAGKVVSGRVASRGGVLSS